MSTIFEAPAQYNRDLRSANKEWRRGKDSSTKWSHGRRPLSGVKLDWATGEAVGATESQRAKARPRKLNDQHEPKDEHNIVKTGRGNQGLPAGRVRGKMSARDEIDEVDGSRSITELLPSPLKMTASDGCLYNFDSGTTPGRPLTLDIFVKTTGRETEKLVEKEYEILDENGDALKGRKARRNLRKASSSPPSQVDRTNVMIEDDGFELV